MQKSWLNSKVDIYFDNPDGEGAIRRGFNNVIQNPSDEQISTFTDAIDQMSDLDAQQVVVSESNLYVY